jgi:HEAT repeat protein
MAMILKPCPFCQKDIPRSITVCPYCHRDEAGQPVAMDTAAHAEISAPDKYFQDDLKELASDDPFIRDQAVIRVARHGTGVVQALLSILNDFAKPGLASVALALGKIGDRRAISVLAQATKMGDEDLRLASVWALAQFHDEEVLPILLAEAERPHPIIQSFIANILGTFQDGRVVPVLTKLASHPNREVAFQAACALGESGGSAAIGVLKSTWRQGDALVRSACAASLRRIGSKPARMAPWTMSLGLAALAALGGVLAWFFYK